MIKIDEALLGEKVDQLFNAILVMFQVHLDDHKKEIELKCIIHVHLTVLMLLLSHIIRGVVDEDKHEEFIKEFFIGLKAHVSDTKLKSSVIDAIKSFNYDGQLH